MEYKVRELSWFKRRTPVKEPKPVTVQVTDIELVNNSYCDMTVDFDDGKSFEYRSRVSQCPIKKTWTVHGFSSASGRQCLVDVIE